VRIPLTARELLVVCVAILVSFGVGVTLKATGSRWAGGDAWRLGGDFVELYTAGRVANERRTDQLYDLAVEEEISHDLAPGSGPLRRAFAYPPFVAMLFQPLASLSYSRAFVVFLIATPIIFLGALALLTSSFGPWTRDERALALLAGLSFFPFIGYNWLGAQISVIGFAAVALGLSEENKGRPFTSGLALSICLYKPSLLVLIVPMLAATGSIRQLAGVAAGGAALALLCVTYAGVPTTLAFVDKLRGTASTAITAKGVFNPYRYVDLNAFFRLLPYGRSRAGFTVLACIVIAAAVALGRLWFRSRKADRAVRWLVWATTLTLSLVVNIYTPLYDTILVVPAAVLAVAASREDGWQGWNRLSSALILVYVTAWIAEFCARTFRVQIYTLVLGTFGMLLLSEAASRLRNTQFTR
jgi:Glycosyltransferase family 87